MKVLLVEDDPLAGKLLSTTLKNYRYTVDLATDGEQGFELAEQINYDLILLDVQLPKLDGIHLCQKLRARGCSTPILMLTARDSSEDMIQGLDAGADDYVIKPCDPDQLAARMRSLLRRREKQIASPCLQWGDLILNPLSAEVTYREETVTLTAKEYGLLELFLRHPQRVFSRSALLDLLWRANDSLVEGTVTNLVKDLRRKLRSAGIQDEVIETLYGLGYRLKALPSQEGAEQEDREAVRSGQLLQGKEGLKGSPKESPQESFKESLKEAQQDSGLDAIAQRFRSTLEERLAYLDTALEAMQRQQIEPQQRQQAHEEAHQLAGTLGLFGYGERAGLMRSIEQVLQQKGTVPESTYIFQLRGALKQFASGTELSERGGQPRQQDRTLPFSSGSLPNWEPRWGNLVAGKVAIVDDDAIALEALQQILQPWGFQIVGFTDPEQFWQQLFTLQIDLVLLDLLMPRLGGIELCQRIRQHLTCGDLPVLIVTAHTDETSIRQLFAAGADDFVSKPVVGPELVTRVSSRLQRRENLHPKVSGAIG